MVTWRATCPVRASISQTSGPPSWVTQMELPLLVIRPGDQGNI